MKFIRKINKQYFMEGANALDPSNRGLPTKKINIHFFPWSNKFTGENQYRLTELL